MNQTIKLWRWILVICIVLITYASLTPTVPTPVFTWEDKYVHAAMYAVLATVLDYAQWFKKPWDIAVAAFSYGFLIEIVQHFTPTRSFDLWDAFANGIGVLIWLLLIHRLFAPTKITVKSRKGSGHN